MHESLIKGAETYPYLDHRFSLDMCSFFKLFPLPFCNFCYFLWWNFFALLCYIFWLTFSLRDPSVVFVYQIGDYCVEGRNFTLQLFYWTMNNCLFNWQVLVFLIRKEFAGCFIFVLLMVFFSASWFIILHLEAAAHEGSEYVSLDIVSSIYIFTYPPAWWTIPMLCPSNFFTHIFLENMVFPSRDFCLNESAKEPVGWYFGPRRPIYYPIFVMRFGSYISFWYGC